MNYDEHDSFLLPIDDLSQVGKARRDARVLAERMDMSENDIGRLSIVITELTRNIVLHAGRGQLLLHLLKDEPRGLELLALDKGPGMADVDRCMRDGYSTAGTPGTGLGAIQRLSDFLEIYSRPELGTAVLCCIRARHATKTHQPHNRRTMSLGSVNLPVGGEQACGDSWGARRVGQRTTIMVADGLGHGPKAAEASQAAVHVFEEHPNARPEELLQRAHGALRSTRGAAISVAAIDLDRREVEYAGVGNIGGVIMIPDGNMRSMVSHNGTVGAEMRRVQTFTYPWPERATLIMYSDGLISHWQPDRYPGLWVRHPGLIAGILYRDYTRGRDDVTVVAARELDIGYG